MKNGYTMQERYSTEMLYAIRYDETKGIITGIKEVNDDVAEAVIGTPSLLSDLGYDTPPSWALFPDQFRDPVADFA